MPDRFHPSTIAQAYREEFPGKFDDISDYALIQALKELDPASYRLIDPLLLGAEILPGPAAPPRPPARLRTGEPYDPAKGPYPLPPTPAAPRAFDIAVGAGLGVVPTFAGAAGGAVAGG